MTRMVPLFRLGPVCLLTGLALVGCTQEGPAIPDAPAGTRSTTTTAPPKADYPLSIQRVGTTAGDRGQRLSIQEDRTVLSTGGSQGQQATCSLDAPAFRTLSQAALDIARTSEGPPTPATENLLFQGIDASDDRVAPVRALVVDLLTDVARPAGKRTLCR
ncbi:hypothetical protein GCM10027517_08420 [Phycicoccus ginsengisoli]